MYILMIHVYIYILAYILLITSYFYIIYFQYNILKFISLSRYYAMTKTYYRDAKAAIICFDIMERNTYHRARHWVTELKNMEKDCKIYLCITKKDLFGDFTARISTKLKAAEMYASSTKSKLFVTSSKTGENIGKHLIIYI